MSTFLNKITQTIQRHKFNFNQSNYFQLQSITPGILIKELPMTSPIVNDQLQRLLAKIKDRMLNHAQRREDASRTINYGHHTICTIYKNLKRTLKLHDQRREKILKYALVPLWKAFTEMKRCSDLKNEAHIANIVKLWHELKLKIE